MIESPPQYGRPALIVRKDGSVSVDPAPKVRLSVNGCPLGPLNEHVCFPAPKSRGKTVLTIAGGHIAKVSSGSRVPVPTSGFTAVLPDASVSAAPGDPVSMSGMEDVLFGVQVGPAAVTGGRPVSGVPEPFWHIKRIPSNLLARRAPYPPALYPYDPEKDRAPRMVLGADGEGRPMLLWFEGAAKHGHVPGEDSCGASLKEAAEICVALGMTEGVHLDGGGSAQILLDGRRSLFISDRDRADHTEAERAVPTGLCVE